ncbi:hypothetical protein F503_01684 [Ophiostoma piceae UAMH 11346]|uniref:Uncharacterized protein n=1 Tax=Ophiostoma piceae (strain UAMH 11346) TaxID=1262450 RepID=S3BSA5_OPHP1|nr:hypothetical protein F503_01684 [Ophiostoma piceae UAMH 11346]
MRRSTPRERDAGKSEKMAGKRGERQQRTPSTPFRKARDIKVSYGLVRMEGAAVNVTTPKEEAAAAYRAHALSSSLLQQHVIQPRCFVYCGLTLQPVTTADAP